MRERIDRIRKTPGSKGVHVWGPEFEKAAAAIEQAGGEVVRLDSGGFMAEWSDTVREVVHSAVHRISHEVLDWQVLEWRETGRALFKATVVEQVEARAREEVPGWGTEATLPALTQARHRLAAESAARIARTEGDDVLTMAAWHLFDRERALLYARYGHDMGDPAEDVADVLDSMNATGERRERLRQLWVASTAAW